MSSKDLDYVLDEAGGAFYGPKIDIKIKGSKVTKKVNNKDESLIPVSTYVVDKMYAQKYPTGKRQGKTKDEKINIKSIAKDFVNGLKKLIALSSKQDVKFFKTELPIKAQSDTGFTEIEAINDSLVFEDKPLVIEKPLVTINGWSLDENKKELESLYLIVNGEPFLKYDYFYPRDDISKKLGIDVDNNMGWTISFLSGYLEDDCQKISVIGIKNERKIGYENEIHLCKN